MDTDVSPSPFFLTLFGFNPQVSPAERLEERMMLFLQNERTAESLDGGAFAQMNGSKTKADYLLGNRNFVAELKTINGDPRDRVEQRLKERFARPGAPIVFGTMGLSPVLNELTDAEQMHKVVHDLSARAVWRHLQKSNNQIGAIKERMALGGAAGLAIIMNDSEPMIDAQNIGYCIKNAFETVDGSYPYLTHIWVNIECHRIRLPDGTDGFPQMLVTKGTQANARWQFLMRMLAAWAHFNGGCMQPVPHHGDWESMRPIYPGNPPSLALF